MPAYGIYARHVRGLELINVTKRLSKPDERPSRVFIDVEDATPAAPQTTHRRRAIARA